jgi:2',3'-cyclic-nucleotide 2'-phosphodiesterase (5'-nucleotidase family)
MKKLLSLLLVFALIFTFCVPALADEPTATAAADTEAAPETTAEEAEQTGELTGSIVILHTNDVHGAIEGYAKVAALKQSLEEQGAYVLLFDAGDFIQGDTSVSISEGQTAIELMNAAGYDAVTMGNHEFDYGFANMLELSESAEFPILDANVYYNGELAFEANTIFEAPDGTKIGVFGLDTPEAATKAHPAKIQGVTFDATEALYATAQAQVDELQAAGCDIIICLGHLGIDEESTGNRSIDVLENVTGIDVLIDGHSHSTLADVQEELGGAEKVGDTYLTSTGTKLANIGVVTITAGDIMVENIDTTELDSDEAIAARAAEIIAEIDAQYGEVFATTEVTLNGERDPGNRTEETNLGDLITDALLWKANEQGEEVDAAITNGGGIRATIEAGDISKKDINTVLPFGNTLNIIKLTGAELLEALEASTYCTPTAIGGFPQVAGIEYTINTAVEFDEGDLYPGSTYHAPNSIGRVTITSIGGKDFDPEATYTIATNDFMASGGDTYYAFAAATVNYDLGIPMDEVVMEYITEVLGGVVTAEAYGEPAGRISIVDEPVAEEEPAGTTAADVFDDVLANAWYTEYVNYVYENGIMNGVGDSTFDLTSSVQRQVLATTLYRMAGSPAVTGDLSAFADGDAVASWAKDAMIWAVNEGIITGTDVGLEPTAVATRQQVATILYRYFGSPAAETADLSGYSDADSIASWAAAAMNWANVNGIITGNDKGQLLPADSMTRVAMAKVLTVVDQLEIEEAPAEEVAAEETTEETVEEAPAEEAAEETAEEATEEATEETEAGNVADTGENATENPEAETEVNE